MYAKRRKPNKWLRADWKRLAFLNFRFDPADLNEVVPYPLDLYEGDAYVSLVAFETSDLCVNWLGRWSRCLMNPFGRHAFLNVRTYVRDRETKGIYFMKEFVNRRLPIPLAKGLYRLPYRYGEVSYEVKNEKMMGEVKAGETFEFEARFGRDEFRATEGSLDYFLAERYYAFLEGNGMFAIEHEPWKLRRLRVERLRTNLLETVLPWFAKGEFVGGLYSEETLGVGVSSRVALD